MSTVLANLEDGRIVCRFDYDSATVAAVKRVSGMKFLPESKGGPYWYAKPKLSTCRDLRKALGDDLKLGEELRSWGVEKVQQERDLWRLSRASTADLSRLRAKLPKLMAAIESRPYQIPAVAFMAASKAPLNGDEPRMGKTLVTIAAVFEADLEKGAHLIIGPRTALSTTWAKEIAKYGAGTAFVAGEGSKAERNQIIEQFIACTDETKWLIIQPSMVRYSDAKGLEYPRIFDIQFSTVTLDESQIAGIVNKKSQTSMGIRKLKRNKTQVTTGSPMKGKARNLWSILNFLDPEEFSSEWQWIFQWLEVGDNGYGKVVGGLREDREEDFYRSLTPYLLRRKRIDVRPDMPNDPPTELWLPLSNKARKQYDEFANLAEVRIDEETLSANNILAEYTRLKQFAWGYHNLLDGKLIPTTDSTKWEAICQLLDERDIFDGSNESQVVIFSQFKEIVDLITRELQEKGVKVGKITGDVNRKGERAKLQNDFQESKLQVMCMTTTAGGVAITLDRAQTVIVCDKTYVPDDQDQAIARIENMARDYTIGTYFLGSENTIEEAISEINIDKHDVNHSILDARRYKNLGKPK